MTDNIDDRLTEMQARLAAAQQRTDAAFATIIEMLDRMDERVAILEKKKK
jgi:flagellar capping protein FliD